MLEWAAHGGDGVTVSEGIQETFRCCIEEHGVVGNTDDMWMVALDILEVFSKLGDIVVL